MGLDNGHPPSAHALPPSVSVSYGSPTLDNSMGSSHTGSSPPVTLSSPPLISQGGDSYLPRRQADKDVGHHEKRSSIDPRRFTSDLDNSLIQQIHTLRLELESKNAAVDSLEESLQQSAVENKQMSGNLSVQAAEARSLRKQMQLLESGTLAALGDIAKERDAAIETMTDTRKRFELSKKKIRSQEEDAEKAIAIREKEQEEWGNEKRNLELKIHVMENRLKTVVAEIAALESTGLIRPGTSNDGEDYARDPLTKADAYSVRSNSRADSRMSTRSSGEYHDMRDTQIRAPSRLSALHEVRESKTSSVSLADELEAEDTEEEDARDNNHHAPKSPGALPEEIRQRSRYSEDQKARKLMGLPTEHLESLNGNEESGQLSMGIIMDYVHRSGRDSLFQYTDAATQFSPPPSPTLPMQLPPSTMAQKAEQTKDAADQRRDSFPTLPPPLEQTVASKAGPSTYADMVCSSCQTDEVISVTPAIVEPEPTSSASNSDSSTQTAEEPVSSKPNATSRLASSSMEVPLIAIIPPASRPPSSHTSVVLPPRTKNAGCQAEIDLPKSFRSISMQTDGIRVDKRPVRLPPRLASSHVLAESSSRPNERRKQTAATLPPRMPRRTLRSPPPILQNDPPPASPPISNIKDIYPGTNDNGPLNDKQQSGPRRPIRNNSIFAGFSDEEDDIIDAIGEDFSDDDTAAAAPIRKTLSKVKDSWKLVPHPKDLVLERLESASDTETQAQPASTEIQGLNEPQPIKTTSKSFQTKSTAPPPLKLNAVKEPDIRRTALVSSGSTAHIQRHRSPSAPTSTGVAPGPPPFPVPTRSSSRKIPISASEGAGSPTPHSTSFFTTRRALHQGRPPIKRKIIRKVQSEAAVIKPPPPPTRPPPPPPMKTPSNPPSTPRSDHQSRNQFILPYPDESEKRKHQIETLHSMSHAGEATIEPPSQQTSVVDAIAQTMVGEWMWKYVRKRTSFGITETPQAEFENGKNGETGSIGGVRHKRWVWLAPYERAVIWSSKQPTSGPALLGKGGRKRKCRPPLSLAVWANLCLVAIQSVLDVKDDTPLPKNSSNERVFHRSILILTPERALKFTATSKERHYIWLTALSFLSASSQGMADLDTPSPEQPPQLPHPPSQEPAVGFRRAPIRDSIRVSKAKSRPSMGPHSFSSPTSETGFTSIPPVALEDLEPDSEEAAEPPQVPRVAAHARKRSSTGPRPVPLSAFHSYPIHPIAASSVDLHGPTARDKYEKYGPSSRRGSGPATIQSPMAPGLGEASIVPNNFFDAVGTVRMEAFVDKKENWTEEKRRPKETRSYRTRQGKKKDMSYWGMSEAAGDDSKAKGDDPFRGF